MSTTASDGSENSFTTSAASTGITSCDACGQDIDQPAAFVQAPFFCSKRCEGIVNVPPPPASRIKSRSCFDILYSDIQVYRGNKSPAFKREFKKRLSFIKAWAEAEHSLSIYTMDMAPWKDMIDHETTSPWGNPRGYHTYALETAYNMAHHDECDGLYMEACTSLLGAIIRVFLMWDLTQLGLNRSKMVGICLDQSNDTLLRGEDVISVPDELLDGELLQLAWHWPKAIDAAIEATVDCPNPPNNEPGAFDFDRSHWKTVIEVIRKVSGSVWED